MTLIRNNRMINDNTKSPPYFVLANQGKYLYITHNCPFLFLFFYLHNEDHNLENIGGGRPPTFAPLAPLAGATVDHGKNLIRSTNNYKNTKQILQQIK
jgi:hypothetical protein